MRHIHAKVWQRPVGRDRGEVVAKDRFDIRLAHVVVRNQRTHEVELDRGVDQIQSEDRGSFGKRLAVNARIGSALDDVLRRYLTGERALDDSAYGIAASRVGQAGAQIGTQQVVIPLHHRGAECLRGAGEEFLTRPLRQPRLGRRHGEKTVCSEHQPRKRLV